MHNSLRFVLCWSSVIFPKRTRNLKTINSSFIWDLDTPQKPLWPVILFDGFCMYVCVCCSDYTAKRYMMRAYACVFACVWCVTPSISCALEKVTLVESSLHLGLPCSWILWVFVLEVMAEWDNIYYICLTADRLVLTHPSHGLMALCDELPPCIEVQPSTCACLHVDNGWYWAFHHNKAV